MKKCNICKAEKPLVEFYKDGHRPDGYQRRCRDCDKAKTKNWRHRNPEYYSAQERRRYWNRREARLDYLAKWRKENPEKTAAHTAVKMALYHGKLKRLSCEVCGNERTDAHHQDYDKPLEVKWLCRKHHAAA